MGRTGAFSESLSTDLCDVDIRLTWPQLQHNMLKNSKKALKLTKTDNITTQYNNIYVYFTICGKLTLAATHLVCRLQATSV